MVRQMFGAIYAVQACMMLFEKKKRKKISFFTAFVNNYLSTNSGFLKIDFDYYVFDIFYKIVGFFACCFDSNTYSNGYNACDFICTVCYLLSSLLITHSLYSYQIM